MLIIYHANEPTYSLSGEDHPEWPKGYKKVAVVASDNLDEAFELTNHIEHDWPTNDLVTAEAGRHRSTSVGDVIVDEKGVVHRCEGSGWSEIATRAFQISYWGKDIKHRTSSTLSDGTLIPPGLVGPYVDHLREMGHVLNSIRKVENPTKTTVDFHVECVTRALKGLPFPLRDMNFPS